MINIIIMSIPPVLAGQHREGNLAAEQLLMQSSHHHVRLPLACHACWGAYSCWFPRWFECPEEIWDIHARLWAKRQARVAGSSTSRSSLCTFKTK